MNKDTKRLAELLWYAIEEVIAGDDKTESRLKLIQQVLTDEFLMKECE